MSHPNRVVEICTFRYDHDPETLAPRGRACQRIAVQEICWCDGRTSVACDRHGYGALDTDARALVVYVRPLEVAR